MKENIINALKVLLFLIVGVVILYFVYQSQNAAYIEDCQLKGIPDSECNLLDKLITDFQQSNYFWLFMVLLVYMASNVVRALRWMMLLESLGYQTKFSNAFWTLMLGYFTNLGIPRSGEFIRAGAFSRYEKISVEKVMGTVVIGRTVDVLCLAIMIALGVILAYDTVWGWMQENASISDKLPLLRLLFWGGLGALVLAGGLFYYFKAQITQTSIYQKILKILQGFWEGIVSVKKVRNPILFIFYSVFIWVMYYLMSYFAFFSFVPTADLTPVAALVAFIFGSLGIVFPSPGGMGTYHFMVIAALGLYGVSGDNAFSLANIIFFSVNLLGNIPFGIAALIVLPLLNKRYKQ